MKFIIVYLFALFCLMQLVACGGEVWVIKGGPVPLDAEIPIENMSKIDSHPLRQSPRIKQFKHLEFEIFKRCLGSQWNDLGCPEHIVTVPGKVQIEIVPRIFYDIYHPKIEFDAKAGQKYFLTWICAPYPISVIADAVTLNIIAIESFCPNCEGLNGVKIEPDNQCVGYSLHPPWMQPDDKKHWSPWSNDVYNHAYRSLCNAANQGDASARLRLALLYLYGSNRLEENHTLAYVWFRLAGSSGSAQAIVEAEELEKKLSTSSLEKAKHLLDNWQPGQCEKQIPGIDKAYKIQVRN